MYLCVYVDDIIVFSLEKTDAYRTLESLHDVFRLRILGSPITYLGMDVR